MTTEIVKVDPPKTYRKPDAVFSPSQQDPANYRVGKHDAVGDVGGLWEVFREAPLRHPRSFMRRLGYLNNPASCAHGRKRFRTQWICMDCGREF